MKKYTSLFLILFFLCEVSSKLSYADNLIVEMYTTEDLSANMEYSFNEGQTIFAYLYLDGSTPSHQP